jgi:hypothetical protein
MSEDVAYVIHRTAQKPALDGRLDAYPWTHVPKSARFGDLATGKSALLDTRMAAVHDDEGLYLGYWVEEPFPTAHLTERDSIIFQENDIELFIDGGDCYWELEINARNTVYEVFFVWQDAYHKPAFQRPELDVVAHRAHNFGGNFYFDIDSFWRGNHPRGTRWAFTDWDFPGMRTATWIDGVLNDPTQLSRGWRCEIFLPWSGMALLAQDRGLPPAPGDVWRMAFARFQNIDIGTNRHQAGWSLTPQGVFRKNSYEIHEPEKFSRVMFSDQTLDLS